MQVGSMLQKIEINVLDTECTGRKIGDMETLKHEMGAWTKRGNEQEKKIVEVYKEECR
jgi:hypothetical protein